MTSLPNDDEFSGLSTLVVEYDPQSPDPARVFRSMALMIDAFHATDRDLLGSVGIEVEPVIYLERVEAGSIRAVIRTTLLAAHDDALKNLNWKPLVGQYLVKAKHRILRWLDERDTIESRSDVTQLQRELVEDVPFISDSTSILIAPVPTDRLLADVQQISNAARELSTTDTIEFRTAGESTRVNSQFVLKSERISELLTSKTVTSDAELVLLVKRPDYLGRSKWEFRYHDQSMEARIDDIDWLERFQRGEVVVRGGDSLLALVRSEASLGFEGATVGVSHQVRKVLGVVRSVDDEQADLKPYSDS